MNKTRLRASAAATCAAVALTVGASVPAFAEVAPEDPATTAAGAAQAAADAANQAFIDGDWDEVLTQAEAFGAAHDTLVVLRDNAAVALADLETGELAEALAAFDEAKKDRRAAQIARNGAKAAADAQQEVKDAARVARNKAVTAKREAEDTLAAAQATALERETAVGVAADAAVAAEAQQRAAEEAFHATIASVVGAPAWWQQINDRPVHVSDLSGAYDEAVATLNVRIQAVADAQAAYDAARGFDRIGARIALEIAKGVRDVAQVRVDTIDRMMVAVDGHAKKQAVADTTAAAETARAELSAAQGAHGQANADVEHARVALEAAIADHAVKAQANKDAKTELDRLRALQAEAQQALFAADAIQDEKEAIYLALLAQQGEGADVLAGLNALLEGLAGAERDVHDRVADLADYRKAQSEIVWGTDAAPGVVRPGDIVSVSFTIPGSADYDLSGVTVQVTSPAGLTPVCDIATDGVVLAGDSVSCTVEYEVQTADVEAGSVTFEVVLEGFLPLGPGNPRAAVVNRAKIEATHSLSFDVEALPVIDTVVPEDVPAAAPVDTAVDVPTDAGDDAADDSDAADDATTAGDDTDESAGSESNETTAETTSAALPTTGGDLGLVFPAGILVALGAGLLVSRRFLQA